MDGADYRQMEELQEERDALSRRCAARLHFAFLDGYLDSEEFDHILRELNQLEKYQRSQA